jgi:hypothetical protein
VRLKPDAINRPPAKADAATTPSRARAKVLDDIE